MKRNYTTLATLFLLFFSTFLKAQKSPIIVSMKAVETSDKQPTSQPNFTGNLCAINTALSQVTWIENAGFKTDKVEVVNAESVIVNEKEQSVKVIGAEKIFTNLKIVKNKTSDKTKVCVDYKLNDDTIYITELIEK